MTETVRAEAARRGLSRMAVQRERERARALPPIEPELQRQIRFLCRTLGIAEGTVATKLGITEGTVVKALATPAVRL